MGVGCHFPRHLSSCSASGSLECWVERVGMGELDFGLVCQLKQPDYFFPYFLAQRIKHRPHTS